MSGHSKWSSIRHQKAIKDARRGKLFSKLALQIAVAARSGAELDKNPTLRMAVETAKKAEMPKANIERAIARGSGEAGSGRLKEVVYEAYGPAGVGIIIKAVTDNKNRTISAIKSTLSRLGGKLAGQGAVSFQFEEKGLIEVEVEKDRQEEAQLEAIEAGAEDVDQLEAGVLIYTRQDRLYEVKKRLEEKGYKINRVEISLEPKNLVEIADRAEKEKVVNLLERLEEIDEVTQTYSNFK
jgi:YebC/PmpR family DNA-binding regulatory protein